MAEARKTPEATQGLSLSVRITAGAVVLIGLTTAVAVFLSINSARETLLSQFSGEFANWLTVDRVLLDASIGGLRKDLLFLARTPVVTDYIAPGGGSGASGRRVESLFSAFASLHPEYRQIRLIGIADGGRELVRVDRLDGQLVTTPRESMQPKGGSDYFQAALLLNADEVYLSEINLNREHGLVEVPHLRMMRAATPLFDPEGALSGVLVINMDAGVLLDQTAANTPQGAQVYLMNDRGDYLVHPDKSQTFGFNLGRRFRFAEDFPEVPAVDGIGDSAPTSAPILVTTRSAPAYLVAGRMSFDPLKPSRHLAIAVALPESVLNAQLAGVRTRVLLVAGLAALLFSLVFYLLVRRALRPLGAVTQAVQAVGRGQFDFALPAPAGTEVGVLVGAFETMRRQLQTWEKALLESNQALTASRDFSDLVIEMAPEAILVADEHGMITYVNSRLEDWFGYGHGELLNQTVEVLLPERFRAGHIVQRERFGVSVNKKRAMGQGRDLLALHKNGQEIPIEAGLGVLNIDGRRHTIVSVIDMRARKATEAEIRELNANLEQRVAARTAELQILHQEAESFAYTISHDLRAPVRAMSGFSQALLEDYGEQLQGDARNFLDQIIIGSQNLSELMDGLLVLCRCTRGDLQLEQIDLSGMARRIARQLVFTDQQRQVRWDIESDLSIWSDSRMLAVVMENLLGNAWKFTQGTPAAVIAVRLESTAAGPAFCVADNGAGFDMAHAGKLFQPFQRLHRQEEFTGTGIGLATVQRILHRLDGEIWAESEVGGGARFYFRVATEPGIRTTKNQVENSNA